MLTYRCYSQSLVGSALSIDGVVKDVEGMGIEKRVHDLGPGFKWCYYCIFQEMNTAVPMTSSHRLFSIQTQPHP
jgi:hypothetical protein